MARGGSRAGAGRKKGSVSKVTEIRQEMIAKATADGLSPLDYMLDIMRDCGAGALMRFEAAKAAAPYVHPRLAAVEHKGDKDGMPVFAILTAVPREDLEEEEINGHSNGRPHHN